ncbi:MAG: sensor histidine kinase [Thiotrichales bacterium]
MFSFLPWIAFLAALAFAAYFLVRYRDSRRHHLLCVELCHRIADELSRRQDEELVVDRVFDVVMQHTQAVVGLLLWRGEDEHQPLRVLRVRGLAPEVIAPGTVLPTAARGYGFEQLTLTGTGELVHEGLREAVEARTGIVLSPRQVMMCVPVTSPPATHGLIQLISSAKYPYTRQTLADVCGLGVYLDAAIQNAKKVELICRQRDAAEALYTIGLTISRFLDIDRILEHAVKENLRLMHSAFSLYMECAGSTDEAGVIRSVAGDFPADFEIGGTIPLAGRMRQMLHADGENLYHNYVLIRDLGAQVEATGSGIDARDDETFCGPEVHARLLAHGVRSAILTPVGVGDRLRGFVCNFAREVNAYDTFHVELQMRIANQVLIALNTADYHAKAKRLALSEERQRMSDDLHDNMAQVINGLALELHSLIKRAGRDHADGLLVERMHAVRARLEEAKATIREAIFELQIPDDTDFWTNLREFASRFEQWHGFKVHADLPEATLFLPIPRQRETLRIVQEALWNARRHSGTNAAWLSGTFGADHDVIVQIEDHGSGLEDGDLVSGQGILTMHNRSERLHGRLTITSPERGGVRVTVEFPHDAT